MEMARKLSKNTLNIGGICLKPTNKDTLFDRRMIDNDIHFVISWFSMKVHLNN